MPWPQTYSPVGGVWVSALLASLPVIVLLGLLGLARVRAHLAALAALASAWTLAVFIFGMPARLAIAASAYGAAYGLFPIGWIVLNAIFLYDITVVTGTLDTFKSALASLSSDRRLQALLVAFSFGAFVEGAAGFGTPVAVSAAMLIALGFRPLPAAGLALIGNTAPVAFGALGTPLIALAGVTGLPLSELSAMVGHQLPVFSVIVPFWLIWAMAGRRAMIDVWPACLTAGASFGLSQYLMATLHGPWLVDVVSALVSIGAVVALLQVWRPKNVWRFPDESAVFETTRPYVNQRSHALGRALLPWLLLSIFVLVWGLPYTRNFFDVTLEAKRAIPVPWLHNLVIKMPPVAASPTPEAAIFNFNWLSATGTGLLAAAIVSGLLLGLRPVRLVRVYGHTLWRVRTSMATIALMLALGYTTRYSGSDTAMGLALASTGSLFPFFSPMIGWLGVALTGSDTSSNVLFGNLQVVTAHQVGMSPVLAAAANSSGGVMGKMIDAQSIVVASVATSDHGHHTPASDILRYVFFHSLALAALVGVLVMIQARVIHP
ncbi:MAG: L-lactate permease [Acidobacteria bacterium]|nr:MAG: L-lactate permease [Acidobacteriota bacterium]